VSTTLLWVAGVSKVHEGRSPPGAEMTMRRLVPARKVWAMGSTGIRTSVNAPAGRFFLSEAR
jgi:hypothetical protein